MPGLEIVTQSLIIVILLLVIALLGYLVVMFHKVNKRLDTILEVLSYYDQAKTYVTDILNGPYKMYFEVAQSLFTTIVPLLTNKRKTK